MALATTKIKISVAKLVERVQEVKKEDEERYAKAKSDYDEAMKTWPAKVLDSLESAKTKIKDLDYNLFLPIDEDWNYKTGSYDRGILTIYVPKRPTKPHEPGRDHDRVLRMLAMVTDDSIIVSPNSDLASYL